MNEDLDLHSLIVWVGLMNTVRPAFENYEDSYIVGTSSLELFSRKASYTPDEEVLLLLAAAHTYRYAGPSCSLEVGMDTIDGGHELKRWEEAPHGVPPLRLGRAGQITHKVPLRRTGKRNS